MTRSILTGVFYCIKNKTRVVLLIIISFALLFNGCANIISNNVVYERKSINTTESKTVESSEGKTIDINGLSSAEAVAGCFIGKSFEEIKSILGDFDRTESGAPLYTRNLIYPLVYSWTINGKLYCFLFKTEEDIYDSTEEGYHILIDNYIEQFPQEFDDLPATNIQQAKRTLIEIKIKEFLGRRLLPDTAYYGQEESFVQNWVNSLIMFELWSEEGDYGLSN